MRVLMLIVVAVGAATAAPRKREPVSTAVVLLIDTGSLSGNTLEAAKDGAKVALEALAPTDQIAIVAFDHQPTIVVPTSKVGTDHKALREAINGIISRNGSGFAPAIHTAYELLHATKATNRHVILLSEHHAKEPIADAMKPLVAAKMTASAIGILPANRETLQEIAELGDGRLYMVEDIGSIPKIFVKEVGEARLRKD
jgi:phosphopantetheinyl transferase (holo-ACP synthase)